MTINTTQLRSFIQPVWQEISSLWSGVDFSFSDPLADSAEHSEHVFLKGPIPGEPHFGINRGHQERCW
jgi:hypothetical protein